MTEITTEDRVLAALRRRLVNVRPGQPPRPIRAIVIARAFGVCPGSAHETRRRGVRRLIKGLREAGHPIATKGDGYWLAQTPEHHQAHQEFLRRSGLTQLASASRSARSLPAADASGQMRLFM